MAYVPPDQESLKRKREVDDIGTQEHAQHFKPPSLQQGTPIHSISYLPKESAERLPLVPGEVDTFGEIINTITAYEGVIKRQESLAASLGAKLAGPRLLKGIDKFFEGPIKTNSPQAFTNAVSWIEICSFAKTNPQQFILTALPDGTRCCQFLHRGLQVEITEDDWRLISSGALNRLQWDQPLEEDEAAEAATLDILEQRTSLLYKRADEVAARARVLHHKLGQRKQDIARRRKTQDTGPALRFQPVNQPQLTSRTSYDLHADLLQQFLSAPSISASRSTSGAGLSVASLGQSSPPLPSAQTQRSITSARPPTATEADAFADIYRPLVTQRIDKLMRGDAITPPCDRCRRLKLQCIKHLTACQGCTKKHAKCSWRSVTEEEAARLRDNVETAEDPPTPRIREVSRPASRGDTGGPAAFGAHGIMSGQTSTGRYELPPVRQRTSLPQAPGPTHFGSMSPVPREMGLTSIISGERHSWGASNPPSR